MKFDLTEIEKHISRFNAHYLAYEKSMRSVDHEPNEDNVEAAKDILWDFQNLILDGAKILERNLDA